MSPKLMRPTQVNVRRNNSSSASPPTVTSPRKAVAQQKTTEPVNSTATAINRPQSFEDDDDDGEEFNEEKLRTIRDKAALKQQQNPPASEGEKDSAILIQKMWRGYSARKQTRDMVERIHKQRTNEYIKKLTSDMEVTKEALENERKIQQLQMQAINALWKKVSAMQVTDGKQQQVANGNGEAIDNVQVVQDLAQTCSMLTNQVQQLQGSMKDILTYMSMFANINPTVAGAPVATSTATTETEKDSDKELKMISGECQTEIVAVHTPQAEQLPFPFQATKLPRPSTLPLDRKLAEEVNAEEASEENLEKIVRDDRNGSGDVKDD